MSLPNYGCLPMNDDDEFIMPNEAFEPIRERVTIDVGALVQQGEIV